jgi:hypothetical protein
MHKGQPSTTRSIIDSKIEHNANTYNKVIIVFSLPLYNPPRGDLRSIYSNKIICLNKKKLCPVMGKAIYISPQGRYSKLM